VVSDIYTWNVVWRLVHWSREFAFAGCPVEADPAKRRDPSWTEFGAGSLTVQAVVSDLWASTDSAVCVGHQSQALQAVTAEIATVDTLFGLTVAAARAKWGNTGQLLY